MNKKFILILLGLIIFGVSSAFAYTISDPIGDQIGTSVFDIYGINVSNTINTITFDIYTNYHKDGKTVGAWHTFAGDLALSLDGDTNYEYGVAFTNHNGLTAGSIYSNASWYLSNNYAPSAGYTYNKNKIVTLSGGSPSGSADYFAWEDITGNNPNYRWRVTLNASDFGLTELHGQNFNVFYSSATCSNDNITGSYTATPEPATMSLLGLGLLGLFGFKRRG